MLVLNIFLTFFLLKGSLQTPLKSDPSIVIIGSGPSGIAAATKLLKNNFTNIKILEAEDRIGGRIHSVKFGDAYVDLGAEFCYEEEGNAVYSMVKDLNVTKHLSGKAHFVLSSGNLLKDETGKKLFDLAVSLEPDQKILDGCENVASVGECLPIKFNELLYKIKEPHEKEIISQSSDWVRNYLQSLESSFDLNDLKITTNYKENKDDSGRHKFLQWNGLGFKKILKIMMQKFPNKENQLPIDDKIFLQKEVKNISNWKNDDKVTVTTVDGSTYEADHVIFTPSVGVLKANLHTLFDPPLPEEKVDAIKNVGFGAILKVILHFPERWWRDDANWPLIWTTEDKKKLTEKKLDWLNGIAGLAQGENNPNVLIAWYAGSHIPTIEKLSDDEILEGQKYLIDTFFASGFNATHPDSFLRTSWYSNPHFLGSYSYESVQGHSNGGSNFPEKLAQPLMNKKNEPKVFFAGEATNPDHFATVHGAIETGYREAQSILDWYKMPYVPIRSSTYTRLG